MRKMFTALSTAAALLAFGATAAQAAVAHQGPPRATPACGAGCFELSSLELGTKVIQNAYVPGDAGVGGRVGQVLDLKRASNSHPNQDFSGAKVGTLASFCGGLIPAESYVCVNYPPSFPVFESDWAPFGNQTGMCAGLRSAGVADENVTLQPCGAAPTTLWVGDLANSTTDDGHFYTPWVNASDPNFSHPLVLTVNAGSSRPANQLKVERLNLLTGGVVPDRQEFTLQFGPVA
jgi:hypothetical protein